MTLNQSALLELTQMLRAADEGDMMRQMLGLMLQALVEAEATSVSGAAPHERTEDRTNQRNGSRPRTVSTTTGDLTVRIPSCARVVSYPARAPPLGRRGVARRHHGDLCPRRVDPQGRRPRRRARRRQRDLQVRGLPDLRQPGRPDRRLRHPPPGRHRVPLS
ncbi:transposase (plasmid) [Pseudomonas sp. BYT-1]|nr:transposase [Pseudomonas sp. BYT-1]URL00915.1 transposase [Pseudomonas sp. BYT-1]